MRQLSGLAVAVAVALAGGTGAGCAQAVSAASAPVGPPGIYVDNTAATCKDTGPGTRETPFCSLQPAFAAVSPGQTIEVVAGTYTGPVTLSASGTASDPITVQFGAPGHAFQSGSPQLDLSPAGSSVSALTLSGASYIDIYDAGVIANQDKAPAIRVENSSHVLITRATLDTDGTGGGIAVSGVGTGVTIERNTFTVGGPAVSVSGAGVADTEVTTNKISGALNEDASGGVTVDGAFGTDVVSNTISDVCSTGVSVSAGASGTVIENNVISVDQWATQQCPHTTATAVGLSVSPDVAATTTEKYDSIGLYRGTPVRWSRARYSSVGAYEAASDEGADDLLLTGSAAGDITSVPADYVDSADALAPAELSADFYGNNRADDPRVANSGTGSGYVDRGATELEDDFAAALSQVSPSSPSSPLQVTATFTVGVCGNWGTTSYTGSINWGDGQATPESASGCAYSGGQAEHTYKTPGQYTVTFDATDGYAKQTSSQAVSTQGTDFTPYGPKRILDTRNAIGAPKGRIAPGAHVVLKIAGNGAIPASVTAVELNLTVTGTSGSGFIGTSPDRNGTPTESNVHYTVGQTVADAAIVPVGNDGSIDVYNEGTGPADVIADVAGYFSSSAASGFQSVPRERILDTRKGIGAPAAQLGPGKALTLAVGGAGAVPADVTAVAVHVTVTDTTGSGWIAAEPEPDPAPNPEGAGAPGTSLLNYAKGQTVSNTIFLPVAAGGKIELYNGGGHTPVDLIADVSGYFSPSAPGSFMQAADPNRVMDTTSTGALKPWSTTHVRLDESKTTTAVVAILTAFRTTEGGYLADAPSVARSGSRSTACRPAASDVNLRPGKTVANLTVLDTAAGQPAATYLYNASPGAVQLYVDVVGWFTTG